MGQSLQPAGEAVDKCEGHKAGVLLAAPLAYLGLSFPFEKREGLGLQSETCAYRSLLLFDSLSFLPDFASSTVSTLSLLILFFFYLIDLLA